MELDGAQTGGIFGLLGMLATILLTMVRNQRKAQEAAIEPPNTKLIDLASDMNQTNQGLASVIEKLDTTLTLQNTRLEQMESRSTKEHQQVTESNQCVVDSTKQVVNAVDLLNRTISPKLETIIQDVGGLPDKINPSIETLTQQLIQTESRVESNMETQIVTNGEILAALLRIEEGLESMKAEFSGRTEKIEADVAAVKADVIKNATSPPAPANQPIVKPDAAPPIAAEVESEHSILNVPKITTETKKDETTNGIQ